jgi:hypothetical protein
MKVSLTIDDNLLIKASQLTGIIDKTALLKAGLSALIALKSHKQPTNWESIEKSDESVLGNETSIALKNYQPQVETTENSLDTFQAIMEISRRCAALPTQDARSEDEILGYNDRGTFSWL